MRCTGHAEYMGEVRNAYQMGDYLAYIAAGGRMILIRT
jgi:hypothetical protein